MSSHTVNPVCITLPTCAPPVLKNWHFLQLLYCMGYMLDMCHDKRVCARASEMEAMTQYTSWRSRERSAVHAQGQRAGWRNIRRTLIPVKAMQEARTPGNALKGSTIYEHRIYNQIKNILSQNPYNILRSKASSPPQLIPPTKPPYSDSQT